MPFEQGGLSSSKPEMSMNTGSGERLLEDSHVDVVSRLHITDPAKIMMPEVYGMPRHTRPEDVRNMLGGFEIVDPKDFMSAVHLLADRAKAMNVPLNKEFLEKVENDQQIGKQERGAAHVMRDNFRGYAVDEPENGFSQIFSRLMPESKLEITNYRIKELDATANEVENARKHPEIRNAKSLAEAAHSLLTKLNHNYMSEGMLRQAARSPNYSPEERAAASMLRANYAAFDALSSPYTGINRDDILALSKLEKHETKASAKQGEANAGCNQKESAAVKRQRGLPLLPCFRLQRVQRTPRAMPSSPPALLHSLRK